jgi:DHA1 family bicyclomycin/chloramphenicol resistance-like MFS transporter
MTIERDIAPHPGLGFAGFVALIAAMMMVNALGIDSMLPALPAMGKALGIPHENDRQWIIAAYLIAFGAATLIYGPLSDRYGRKPVLIMALVLNAVASASAVFATSFVTIIVVRVMQGLTAASTRVIATSIVRDCYSGRQMARVMSLVFIVFLAVPVLAPGFGQLILLVAPWQWIFLVLGVFSLVLAILVWFRLPETLHPDDVRRIAAGPIAAAFRVVLTDRQSIGYTLASTVLLGALFGFITSVQQVFTDIFRAEAIFPLVFAGIAGSMAVSSLLNSRFVQRLGTRRISHTGLIGFILVSGAHLIFALGGRETLLSFALFQAVTMFCFAFAGSNFSSMAMAPVGHIAGTASSVQAFVTMIGGSLIGAAIGQSFDGTTVPLVTGFFLLGCASLAIVLWTEHGRLFRPSIEPTH